MRERDCSTCRLQDNIRVECFNCHLNGHPLYEPQHFWSPSERAGLKALGTFYKHQKKLEAKFALHDEVSVGVSWAIVHYVRASIESKEAKDVCML